MAELKPLTKNVGKLIPRLKFLVRHEKQNLPTPEGPLGRLKKLRATVTALYKYERIEMNKYRAIEARGYAERLITEAIRNGDCHKPTMELADFWLEEKQLIHKLFKVLVPRYVDYTSSFTMMHHVPLNYEVLKDNSAKHPQFDKVVLELRENPYPPMPNRLPPPNRNTITNVLLEGARLKRNKI